MIARDITHYGGQVAELSAVVPITATANREKVTLHIKRDSKSQVEVELSNADLRGLTEMMQQVQQGIGAQVMV